MVAFLLEFAHDSRPPTKKKHRAAIAASRESFQKKLAANYASVRTPVGANYANRKGVGLMAGDGFAAMKDRARPLKCLLFSPLHLRAKRRKSCDCKELYSFEHSIVL
jgi:hypothetical protein